MWRLAWIHDILGLDKYLVVLSKLCVLAFHLNHPSGLQITNASGLMIQALLWHLDFYKGSLTDSSVWTRLRVTKCYSQLFNFLWSWQFYPFYICLNTYVLMPNLTPHSSQYIHVYQVLSLIFLKTSLLDPFEQIVSCLDTLIVNSGSHLRLLTLMWRNL